MATTSAWIYPWKGPAQLTVATVLAYGQEDAERQNDKVLELRNLNSVLASDVWEFAESDMLIYSPY